MQYDSNEYTTLGVGEQIKPDTLWLNRATGTMTPVLAGQIGQVVDEDITITYVRRNEYRAPATPLTLPPTTPAPRKSFPIVTGVLDYFPDALLAVAACSKAGNEQHNPGTQLHWDRSKSGDEADALGRHLLTRGTLDTDGIRHTTKVAWRALAMLQKEIEADNVKEGLL